MTAYVSTHPRGRPGWGWTETAEPPGGAGRYSRLIVKLLQSSGQEWNTVLKNKKLFLSLKAILLAHKGRSELHRQSFVITEFESVLKSGSAEAEMSEKFSLKLFLMCICSLSHSGPSLLRWHWKCQNRCFYSWSFWIRVPNSHNPSFLDVSKWHTSKKACWGLVKEKQKFTHNSLIIQNILFGRLNNDLDTVNHHSREW